MLMLIHSWNLTQKVNIIPHGKSDIEEIVNNHVLFQGRYTNLEINEVLIYSKINDRKKDFNV